MRPPTTWSEKSASAEDESTPVEVSSKLGPTWCLGFSERKLKRHSRSRGAELCRPRYRDADTPDLAETAELLAANAPCAIVPLKPNELSREICYDSLSVPYIARGSTSTGIWNGLDATIDERCTFSLKEEEIDIIINTR